MTFTDADRARLKVHTTIRKNKKVDTSDIVHKCQHCGFRSKYRTSVTRHENKQH